MPVQSSGTISYGDLREETYKTQFVNPDYPKISVANAADMCLAKFQAGDRRHTLGLLDGRFSLTAMLGWSTWDVPQVNLVYLEQYAEDGGVRVAWKTTGGDPFRTGFVVEVATTQPSGLGTSGTWVRFGTEDSPGSADVKEQYSVFYGGNDRDCMALKGNLAYWTGAQQYGNYNRDVTTPDENADPDGSLLYDYTTFVDGDTLWCSAVFPSRTVAGGPSYYATVIPIDGRQFHTLTNDIITLDVNDSYTVTDYTTGSYTSYINDGDKYAVMHPDDRGFDSFDPTDENKLTLYGGLTSLDLIENTTDSITVSPFPHYNYFLGRNTNNQFGYSGVLYWVYITDNYVLDLGQPFYPNQNPTGDFLNADISDSHPYYEFNNFHNPERGTIINTTVSVTESGDDGVGVFKEMWTLYQGDPIIITRDIEASTSYDIYVCKYKIDDEDRYGSNKSGPAPDGRDVVSISVITPSSPTTPPITTVPTLNSVTINGSPPSISDLYISIEEDPATAPIADDYNVQYKESTSSTWLNIAGYLGTIPPGTTRNLTMFLESGTQFVAATTYDFRVRSVDTSTGDYSYWSNTVQDSTL